MLLPIELPFQEKVILNGLDSIDLLMLFLEELSIVIVLTAGDRFLFLGHPHSLLLLAVGVT